MSPHLASLKKKNAEGSCFVSAKALRKHTKKRGEQEDTSYCKKQKMKEKRKQTMYKKFVKPLLKNTCTMTSDCQHIILVSCEQRVFMVCHTTLTTHNNQDRGCILVCMYIVRLFTLKQLNAYFSSLPFL